MTRIFLNGQALELAVAPGHRYLGRALLERFHPGDALDRPSPGAPPYLFCGNGACRDCDLLVDGLPRVPSCRVPLAEGLSLRTVPDTAMARRLPAPLEGEPLVASKVVVGAGPAGRAVSNAVLLEARAPEARPVGVAPEGPVVFERGRKRRVRASTLVLATGARDVVPARADVLPMDLIERYVDKRVLPLESPRTRVVLVGEEERVGLLFGRLRALGAEKVTVTVTAARETPPPRDGRERDRDGTLVVMGARREPSLDLARALGCKTRYDRGLGADVLVLTPEGETTVPGIFATGDVAMGSDNAREREAEHDPS